MNPSGERFVGPNKVLGVEILERKTPAGGEIVRVLYEGDNLLPDVMPMKTFERLVGDVPRDYDWLRETRYKALIDELTAVALEHDVRYADLKYVGTVFAQKMDAAFERATNFLWTGDDKQWIPGFAALSDRTLLEAEDILKRIQPDGKPKDEGK